MTRHDDCGHRARIRPINTAATIAREALDRR
jgi:hypothetical protein